MKKIKLNHGDDFSKTLYNKVSWGPFVKTFDGMKTESLKISDTIINFITFKNIYTSNMNYGEIMNANKHIRTLYGDIWIYIDKTLFILTLLNNGKKYGFLPSQLAINPKKTSHDIYKTRLNIFLACLIFKACGNDVDKTNDTLDMNELSLLKEIVQNKIKYDNQS